ncbi:glutamyl-tRNA amidotransferase-like protein subunit A [Dendryphion nanum]|uniref:Glutamyl-tRNA amidotransferase-like protein subunit A n=1 Tax=Dendryphion nanum TaxID=256645 RepID=A0A9P9EJW0_9PLEO|nr:glutamyl-tRNA amidotransferase-like protein subunit A [Dendryphion nanum]
MTSGRAPTGFINYPTPQVHDIPYKAPPPNTNPVLKGLLLHYLSPIVLSIPGVPSFLWNNAGFTTLRNKKELNNIPARYEPTVIRLSQVSDTAPVSLTIDEVGQANILPAEAPGRFHTTLDFHHAYKAGKITPTDVIEKLLPLIRRDVAQRSPHSTAFVDTNIELVRKAAAASTKRWREGKPLGILDGVPFSGKDELSIKGYKRFDGTKKDHSNGNEAETSWCVTKLEELGAIFVGKTSMHEIGMDTNNNNPNWGTPLNPYNAQYYCGGSSGGSAYTVAAGLVPFSVAADGGGSIRIPSNYCGLYGLKPSHGRISIAPATCHLSTTTVRGPIAANMTDLKIAYHALAQPDPSHPTSSQFAAPAVSASPSKKTIGIPRAWFDRADPSVQEACLTALSYLHTHLDYTIIDISIPLLHEGQMAHSMTILSETCSSGPDLKIMTPATNILMRVAQCTPATDFLLAQRLRNLISQHLAHLFQTHPGLIIVTPTTPNAGWPIGAGELAYGVSDANTQIRNMEYVWLANFVGTPCIQVPVGYAEAVQGEGKVPVGMSGMGEWGSEDLLLEFGSDAEKWLNEGSGGGRLKPKGWVDVLGA